jgi:hypothetical protein
MTPTITGMSAEEHVSGWGRLKANDEVDSKSRAEGCIANGGRADGAAWVDAATARCITTRHKPHMKIIVHKH